MVSTTQSFDSLDEAPWLYNSHFMQKVIVPVGNNIFISWDMLSCFCEFKWDSLTPSLMSVWKHYFINCIFESMLTVHGLRFLNYELEHIESVVHVFMIIDFIFFRHWRRRFAYVVNQSDLISSESESTALSICV